MERQELFDGTEVAPGYCRALRVGNTVFVSGTGSADETGNVVGDDVYNQTKIIYAKIDKALSRAGATLEDVVRLTVYVTDISTAGEFLRAHSEVFGSTNPTCTLAEVSGLVKNFKVEIEAQAMVA